MIKKIWLINWILAVMMLFFLFKACGVFNAKEELNVPKQVAHKESIGEAPKYIKKTHLPENNYNSIVERNLFAPQRVEIVEVLDKKPETPEPAKIEPVKPIEAVNGKEIKLFGVILLPNFKSAIISNPEIEKGGKSQRNIKVGETLGEFKVVDIQKDRILLSKKGDRFEILLYDEKKPKKRDQIKNEKKQKDTSAPTVITTNQESIESNQSKKKSANDAGPEYEIIETPFGNIKRRKK